MYIPVDLQDEDQFAAFETYAPHSIYAHVSRRGDPEGKLPFITLDDSGFGTFLADDEIIARARLALEAAGLGAGALVESTPRKGLGERFRDHIQKFLRKLGER
jgi:hypothetical protein